MTYSLALSECFYRNSVSVKLRSINPFTDSYPRRQKKISFNDSLCVNFKHFLLILCCALAQILTSYRFFTNLFSLCRGNMSKPSGRCCRVFSFLDIVSLCRCAQVCKYWNILALDGSNWKRIDLFSFQVDVQVSFSRRSLSGFWSGDCSPVG